MWHSSPDLGWLEFHTPPVCGHVTRCLWWTPSSVPQTSFPRADARERDRLWRPRFGGMFAKKKVWCFGDLSVMCWWCLGHVGVKSPWCVVMVLWCFEFLQNKYYSIHFYYNNLSKMVLFFVGHWLLTLWVLRGSLHASVVVSFLLLHVSMFKPGRKWSRMLRIFFLRFHPTVLTNW